MRLVRLGGGTTCRIIVSRPSSNIIMDQTQMLMQSHPHSHAAQKLFAHYRNRVQTLGMGFIGAI